ncbi:MAG TPA: T9SS type A sorting domain-containing protein [Bacteroidales bacterium]
MKKIVLSFILAMASVVLLAQVPTDQDCLGAIPVCQDTYDQPNSYVGTGNYPNEIPTGGSCPGNCMQTGERNDVWYIFTVQESGNLNFLITPYNSANDYDWVVYSLNEYKCQDIISHSSEMQVSCNWSGIPGPTGPNGQGTTNCQDDDGSKFNAVIPVLEGETYVINISNYSTTNQNGYLLDFSASTAVIFDDVSPTLAEVETEGLQCGLTNLTFKFSEKVLCSSVQASDFDLSGPGGPYTVTDVFGEACDLGGETENIYTITFDPPIFQSGNYALSLTFLNGIQDACGNITGSQTLSFYLNLSSPVANAGPNMDVPFLGTATFNATVQGGSGNYSYDWQPAEMLVDPTIEDPTTVPLTVSTQFTFTAIDENSTCQSSDVVMANVVGGEMSIALTADPTSVCAGNQVNLMAIPSGGSGTYAYSWTSDPPGFTSDISSPSAFPMVPTVFYVEVFDGYSTITSDVSVGVLPKPVADAGPDQVINVGTVTTLQGSASEGQAPYDYIWNPAGMIDGPSNIPNPQTVVLNAPQNYTLLVSDNNGCPSDISSVLINAAGEGLACFPQAEPSEICIGESTILYANATGGGGSYTYYWTNNLDPLWSATSEVVSVTPATNTVFTLEVNDGFTSFSNHINVQVNLLPQINLIPAGYPEVGPDTISACVRDTIVLDAGNATNPPNMQYLWSNSWANRYMLAQTNGNWWEMVTYSVAVKNPVTGCSSTDSITVIFDFNNCAIGVEENIDSRSPVTIHPNPNQGTFSIRPDENIEKLTIQLMSIQGAEMFEKTFIDMTVGSQDVKIDMNNLAKGVYLLRILANERVYTKKIVKN